MNQHHRILGEDLRWHAADDAEPAGDERCCFVQAEGFQLTTQCHSLTELAQIVVFQAVGEFGLAGEHQRKQFGGRRFDVRQQPDLLEQLDTQALRFVDHQRHDFSAVSAFPQRFFEPLQKDRLRFGRIRAEIELECEKAQEILWPKGRIT